MLADIFIIKCCSIGWLANTGANFHRQLLEDRSLDRREELQRRGIAVLLVEQKLAIALEISERCYVMGHGRIVFEGTPADLRANNYIRKEWLEV